MLLMHLKNFDWTQMNVMQCTVHWGPCAGENSGRGWLSLAAESWYAACRDLVKMRWMRVKGEWEGWRKEGGGGFSRFLAGVRYQEAAKALLMPHTSSPRFLYHEIINEKLLFRQQVIFPKWPSRAMEIWTLLNDTNADAGSSDAARQSSLFALLPTLKLTPRNRERMEWYKFVVSVF